MSSIRVLPLNLSTTQKIVVAVSVTAGVALVGILANVLGRRKAMKLGQRRARRGPSGRRTRNSIRSPNNDMISLAGSKASARSMSPGGSVHAMSDRLSLASGSLGAGVLNAQLTPQQLGVMGMEALETVIGYWEDALAQHSSSATLSLMSPEDSEFCKEIHNLLDVAYALQEQSELLFLDERSVLFREEEIQREVASLHGSRVNGSHRGSDPGLDSGESFASALDQIADLREFEDFLEALPEMEKYPLYQSAVKHLEEQPVPYRSIRTEMVNCSSDAEYLAKLHCLRLAFQYLSKDDTKMKWIEDCGRQVLTDLLCLADKDPKDFLVAYESMVEYLHDENNWEEIERELELRNVKAMTFYDICLDFIVLDAFRDLDAPPSSVLAVVQNRFLTNGFKETALATAVWSVLKAKRRFLKFPNGFMSHFYAVSEHTSPIFAWGFFGPNEYLSEVCHYFRDQMVDFLKDLYNFQKVRYTTVEDLASDIFTLMKQRVDNIGVKFSQ
ncbi:mitoguardin [Culicoides brevitarsis]|uniref:mitoguardin n=1 Tax=Culicoides brevitarsis TaxID=469753 RepID=UPI00307CB9A5